MKTTKVTPSCSIIPPHILEDIAKHGGPVEFQQNSPSSIKIIPQSVSE